MCRPCARSWRSGAVRARPSRTGCAGAAGGGLRAGRRRADRRSSDSDTVDRPEWNVAHSAPRIQAAVAGRRAQRHGRFDCSASSTRRRARATISNSSSTARSSGSGTSPEASLPRAARARRRRPRVVGGSRARARRDYAQTARGREAIADRLARGPAHRIRIPFLRSGMLREHAAAGGARRDACANAARSTKRNAREYRRRAPARSKRRRRFRRSRCASALRYAEASLARLDDIDALARKDANANDRRTAISARRG